MDNRDWNTLGNSTLPGKSYSNKNVHSEPRIDILLHYWLFFRDRVTSEEYAEAATFTALRNSSEHATSRTPAFCRVNIFKVPLFMCKVKQSTNSLGRSLEARRGLAANRRGCSYKVPSVFP